jgi:glyoxylase-like metal-dependent hydrolase (beta-lactamase superfamily II)
VSADVVVPGLRQVKLGYVNAYLIEGDSGLVVVDTGLPGKLDAIEEAVVEAGFRTSDVSDILITHSHLDHIGSLAALTGATGARVRVHPEDRAVTTDGVPSAPMTGRNLVGKLMVFTMRRPKAAQPVETTTDMTDGETLELAGGLTVIHTPGHTPGHVSLLWRDGSVMISGDAAMNLSGRVAPPPVAEDHVLAARSFRRLVTFDFDTAVFGHGRPVVGGASEVLRTARI